MQPTFQVSVLLGLIAGCASASPVNARDATTWSVTDVVDYRTTSSTGESSLTFNFKNEVNGISTTCTFEESPGSGRPVYVNYWVPCENPDFEFQYITTSATQSNLTIQEFYENAAGNLQGIQTGSGEFSVTCTGPDTDETCTASNVPIAPGAEA